MQACLHMFLLKNMNPYYGINYRYLHKSAWANAYRHGSDLVLGHTSEFHEALKPKAQS